MARGRKPVDELYDCHSVLNAPLTAVETICDPSCHTGVQFVLPTLVSGSSLHTALYQPLFIRWQSSDLALIAAATATAAASSTTAANPTGLAPPPGSDEPQPGLSVGARAGTGVAVGLTVVGIFLLLGWWFMRTRRRLLREEQEEQQLPPPRGGAEELEAPAAKARAELAADGGRDRASELPAGEHKGAEGGDVGELSAEREGREVAALDATPKEKGPAAELPGESDTTEPSTGFLEPELSPKRRGKAVEEIPPQKEPQPIAREVGEGASGAPAEETVAADGPEMDQELQLVEEERRLAERRATLQETLRLLKEDERLRSEQEAVKKRLESFRKTQ